MSSFLERPHGGMDWEHLEDSHHVVYLVKRPAYALVLAMPRTPPATSGEAQASCRLRLMDTRQTCDIALGLSQLVNLYEDLHQLLEYMLQEREKRCGQP